MVSKWCAFQKEKAKKNTSQEFQAALGVLFFGCSTTHGRRRRGSIHRGSRSRGGGPRGAGGAHLGAGAQRGAAEAGAQRGGVGPRTLEVSPSFAVVCLFVCLFSAQSDNFFFLLFFLGGGRGALFFLRLCFLGGGLGLLCLVVLFFFSLP